MSRQKASGLTRQMLPPDAQTYVPEELQDRDLPLWFAAFECGRRAANVPASTSCRCGAKKSMPEPEQIEEVVKWADPPEQANYGDPIPPEEDEDTTLSALIAHAGMSKPHIDPAALAQLAPSHDEISGWIKACKLPSGRLVDMVLDGLVEARGKSILRSA